MANRNIYKLKVLLTQTPFDQGQGVWRVIEIRGTQTLVQLHRSIFKAFNRWEEHLYSFFLSRNRRDANQEYASPYYFEEDDFSTEALPRDAAQAKIDTLRLIGGQKFWYVFDYGDDWDHTVEVMSISQEEPRGRYPRIIEREGDSPDQHPRYEEDEDLEPLEDEVTEPGRILQMYPDRSNQCDT